MSQIAQLAEAIPVPGSGVTLPLNLHAIAARCSNAYYAPKVSFGLTTATIRTRPVPRP